LPTFFAARSSGGRTRGFGSAEEVRGSTPLPLQVDLAAVRIGFITTGGFGSGAVNNYLTGFLGGVLAGAILFVIIKRNLTILGRQLFQL
jgi:hypothetical protein